MVMHARKPARIGDGYFEKHQAHPYQNSKYSSSKSSYDRDRMRERDSPNGNSYRSDSPECESPRERSGSYHSKSLYLPKGRDKERENRDYKSRDKYSDCVRSPKDKRIREVRESEHRTNHDRNSLEKNDIHSVKLSSQNSSRDTSQRKLSISCQDKERRDDRDRVVRVGDWSEHLSSSGKKYYYNCKTEVSQWEKPREWVDPRPQSRHLYPQQSSRTVIEKHSNNSRGVSGSGGGGSSSTNSGSVKGGSVLPSSRSGEKVPVTSSGYWPQSTHHDTPTDPRKPAELPSSAERQFCPEVVDGQATDMEISGDSTPTSEFSVSALPVVSGGGELTPAANAPGPPLHTPIHVDTSSTSLPQDPGPPTPTHSETQDCTDARKLLSPPSSLSSLQSFTASSTLAAAVRPQAPNLTPSLANHYRDDLVNHVRGWPADVLEKQAQKLSEEAHGLGSMCTRVSAELKCARSVVRLTEIQATLQEQRVLFLRQQIKNLEELKSQNSFMADEA